MLYPGYYLDEYEVDMLSRVCRSVCKENDMSLTSFEAEKTASHLLKLFMNGLTGEEELLDAARNRMKWQLRTHAYQKATALQHIAPDRQPDIRQETA